ncbi:hypothetical protein ACWEL8_09545 [Streptomyces sp. NPDC004690]
MPTDPAPSVVRPALSPLDHRIEAVTGHDVDTLWQLRDSGVLDEPHTHLVDQHRKLAEAQTGVTFYRRLLARLASGEFSVDGALFARIARTVDQLEAAAGVRDAAVRTVLDALEPIESAAAPASGENPLTADDQAALLAIAGGAKLHEHLLTGRMSVTTASGTRVAHAKLTRLQEAGLVTVDTSHPEHAGQPVELTQTGRAALVASRRSPASTPVPKPPQPGAWPSAPAPRR